MFKPLIIPRKLQQALPYKDKPKYGVRKSEQKKPIDRVAVIKEPHEQKVSNTIFHYCKIFKYILFFCSPGVEHDKENKGNLRT